MWCCKNKGMGCDPNDDAVSAAQVVDVSASPAMKIQEKIASATRGILSVAAVVALTCGAGFMIRSARREDRRMLGNGKGHRYDPLAGCATETSGLMLSDPYATDEDGPCQ